MAKPGTTRGKEKKPETSNDAVVVAAKSVTRLIDTWLRRNGTDPRVSGGADSEAIIPVEAQVAPGLVEEYRSDQRKTSRFQLANIIVQIVLCSATLVALCMTFRAVGTAEKQQRVMETQLLPYVTYESGKVEIAQDGNSYVVTVNAKNVGQTPAFSVSNYLNARVDREFPEPQEHLINQKEFPFEETGEETTDVGQGLMLPIVKEFPGPGKNTDHKFVYVWGVLKHRDLFQRCQLHIFRLKSRGPFLPGAALDLVPVANATDLDVRDCPVINGRRKAKFPRQ